MITQIRARVARWIQPRPRLAGIPALRAFADRIEAGQLTAAERVELAQLVVVAVAAVHLLERCPHPDDPGGWSVAVWAPVIDQVRCVDRVAGHGRGDEQ